MQLHPPAKELLTAQQSRWQQVKGQSCRWRKVKCCVVFWWSWLTALASV